MEKNSTQPFIILLFLYNLPTLQSPAMFWFIYFQIMIKGLNENIEGLKIENQLEAILRNWTYWILVLRNSSLKIRSILPFNPIPNGLNPRVVSMSDFCAYLAWPHFFSGIPRNFLMVSKQLHIRALSKCSFNFQPNSYVAVRMTNSFLERR